MIHTLKHNTRSKIAHITICVMALLISISLFGCESKSNAVYELLEFRQEIKEHCKDYTESEWEDAIDRYSEICEELDKIQFTKEEYMEINKIKGEIAGYAATVAAQEVSDRVQTITDEIESFADGFDNTFQSPKFDIE